MRGPPVDGGDPEDTSVGYKYRLRAAIACFTCARRLTKGRSSPHQTGTTRSDTGSTRGVLAKACTARPRWCTHRRHGCNPGMLHTRAQVLCLWIGAGGVCVTPVPLLPRRQCHSKPRHPAGRSPRAQRRVGRGWILARLWHLEHDGESTAQVTSTNCNCHNTEAQTRVAASSRCGISWSIHHQRTAATKAVPRRRHKHQ